MEHEELFTLGKMVALAVEGKSYDAGMSNSASFEFWSINTKTILKVLLLGNLHD